jgi:hypothetical protein
VRILKDFKSNVLDLRMIKDLQTRFSELRILKGLGVSDPPTPRLRRAGAAAFAERRKRTDLVLVTR